MPLATKNYTSLSLWTQYNTKGLSMGSWIQLIPTVAVWHMSLEQKILVTCWELLETEAITGYQHVSLCLLVAHHAMG